MSEQVSPENAPVRRVLLLAHTGREDARDVARAFCKALTAHGIVVRLIEQEAADLDLDPALFEPGIETVPTSRPEDRALTAADCELAVVIGGDGTILRAAELTHGTGTPLLAVTQPDGDLALMVKPQFEVGKDRVGRGGVAVSYTHLTLPTNSRV